MNLAASSKTPNQKAGTSASHAVLARNPAHGALKKRKEPSEVIDRMPTRAAAGPSGAVSAAIPALTTTSMATGQITRLVTGSSALTQRGAPSNARKEILTRTHRLTALTTAGMIHIQRESAVRIHTSLTGKIDPAASGLANPTAQRMATLGGQENRTEIRPIAIAAPRAPREGKSMTNGVVSTVEVIASVIGLVILLILAVLLIQREQHRAEQQADRLPTGNPPDDENASAPGGQPTDTHS
jgi:hypothetical protein